MIDESIDLQPPYVQPPLPGKREVLALRVLQAGAIAVVLAASTYKTFELDRFFVPKEIALHLTALLCGLLIVSAFRRSTSTRLDILLIAYLAVSALSALFATNYWQAIRALTVSASGIAIFWTARTLRQEGLERQLLMAVALAVVIGTFTSLLQTYGLRTDLFSLNRAPGGTLGNRNFVAHLGAFGLPVVMLCALRAQKTNAYLIGAVGAAIVTAMLVLTRSRAAWLAFIAAMAVFLFSMLASRALRTDGRTWARWFGMIIIAGIGVGAAMLVPNTLRWNSDNPYRQTMKSVTNYQEGSGHGRMIQYKRSLRMTTAHALLGVGPGNWSVEYPKHAARRDPSLNASDPGTTANPWPSSDWVAFISERGAPAAIMLLLVFGTMALQGLARLFRAQSADEALAACTLVATITAALVTGAFDAVLLLALPTVLVWSVLGALWSPSGKSARAPRTSAFMVLTLIAGLGAARSIAQIYAMNTYSNTNRVKSLEVASLIDPGNFRLHMRLARSGSGLKRKARCSHARAAHALYPSSRAARSLYNSCK